MTVVNIFGLRIGRATPRKSAVAYLRRKRLRGIIASILIPTMALWSGPAMANPSGGSVVHGGITMNSRTGGVLDIKQSTQNAIINWESFSIDGGELTRFRQPDANAAVLNRVTGGDPSAIHGALRANGNVFVINPNGILVGAGGSIDVHGLVLSTLDIDNGEFLARGDALFKGESGDVTNLGRINAIGGDVFLIGQTVSNRGSISASEGTVGLAAGEEVLLKAGTGPTNERIFVQAKGSGVSGTGVYNDGTIEGAAVELKAHGNMYALAINNKGTIRATGVVNSGGRVHLRGVGGQVSNTGSIQASSNAGNAVSRARILIESAYAKVDGELRASGARTGGEITIKAENGAEVGGSLIATSNAGVGGQVDIEASEIALNSDTLIDVSGHRGGGQVNIGGGFQGGDPNFRNAETVVMMEGAVIRADATDSGNGGTVVLWSDGLTEFKGEISAEGRAAGHGGFVEVSGREGLIVGGTVSTAAENGAHGVLLLDPKNITISTASSSASVINNGTLTTLLGSNHVVISTFDAGSSEAGNISVSATVVYNSANSLTLLAEGDLYIGNNVINRGAGNVNLVAGWDPSVLPLSALVTGTPHATLPLTSGSSGFDMDSTIFAQAGAFGNGGGSVYVGSLGAPNTPADRAVSVGSRTGQTNVAGYDVNVWGSALTGGINAGAQRYSQIGYNRRAAGTTIADPVTGRIKVKALNDISVISNKYEVGEQGSGGWNETTNNTGKASFAQIGHGGERDSVRDMTLSGDIIVEAGRDLNLLGGKAYNNYAKVGHGGYDNPDTTLSLVARIDGGDISVAAGRNVLLQGGLGYYANVQIGHGGGQMFLSDFAESTITVNAGGDVSVNAGAGVADVETNSFAYAQIGHGGYKAPLISNEAESTAGSGKGYKGDIHVTAAGKVSVTAGDSDARNYAVIGNGGDSSHGDHSGNINVTAGTGVSLTGGSGADALFAQIGHVAYFTSGEISGNIQVVANQGGIQLFGGGAGSANHAVIGSGGYVVRVDSILSGNVTVHSLGSGVNDGIILKSGDGNYANSQIGHFSQYAAANGPVITLSGDVDVKVVSGGLLMEASALGSFSHVGIGHGGRDVSGDKTGNIWVKVVSGDIEVLGGGENSSNRYNHAQIGHGGYANGSPTNTDAGSGEVDGIAQGIHVLAESGNIVIRGGGNSYSYAMIGNGGARAGGAATSTLLGDITVSASGDITVEGGSKTYTYAQIGNGGVSSVSGYVWHLGGAIKVEAGGSILGQGGAAQYTYTQIGHGGVSTTTTSTIAASPITVTAKTGDIHLYAGNIGYAGSKIGHGNTNLKLSSFGESSITVEAGRDIRLVSPQFETYTTSSHSATQIGHGGFEAMVGVLADLLGYSGDIEVTAGGKLDILAGKNAGSYTYSLIGHNSYFNSIGQHSGDITVTTGTQAGLSEYGITIHAANGDFLPLASANSTTGVYYSFAAIGHRGHSNNVNSYSTGLSGDILVDAVRGGISILGGDGVDGSTAATTLPDIRLNDAMIGHGGFRPGHATAGINGSVRVYAEGDILLRAGTSRQAVTMIGNGGYDAFGPIGRAEDVIVVVSRSGSLEMDSTLSINTGRGGVMIGNGSPLDGSGTRMGDILIDVAGEISLLGNYTVIGHRSGGDTASVSNADITIRARSMDQVSGDSGSELFKVGGAYGSMLAQNLVGGELSLIAIGTQGLEIDSAIVGNSAHALNLLAYSDIFIAHDLINQGSGNLNIFAGWDPAATSLYSSGPLPSVDYREYWVRDIDADEDLFDVLGTYGNAGSIWVGAHADLSAANRGVSVASRIGETNVGGNDVNVWGSALTGGTNSGEQRFSQIGYNRLSAGTSVNEAASGRIRVSALNDLFLVGNKYEVGTQGSGGWSETTNNTGKGSFAQIGHGGALDSVRDMTLSGDIIVDVGAGLSLLGGKAYANYAAIGHGGFDMIEAGYAPLTQILGGDLSVEVGGDVLLQGGLGYHARAQIGHGGGSLLLADFAESAITVRAGGDVAVHGGAGVAGAETNAYAYSQIGHGGYEAAFMNGSTKVTEGSGKGYQGDIIVNAGGNVSVKAGDSDARNFAVIGHGGDSAPGDHSGDIRVTAGTGVSLTAGSGADALFAQIGHIAYRSSNRIEGDVLVVAQQGGVQIQGGAGGAANHALIGHGGYGIQVNSVLSGNVTVHSLGLGANDGITLRSGDGNYASAHIGHFGQNTSSDRPAITLSGDVEVKVTNGGLLMEASALGYFSHVAIGHGGRELLGTKEGNVWVEVASGDIEVLAGGVHNESRYNHAQIGHGGYANGGSTEIDAGSGVIGGIPQGIHVLAESGNIVVRGGQNASSYAMIGNGGTRRNTAGSTTINSDISVKASGDIILEGGGKDQTFAQIGNGGSSAIAKYEWDLTGAVEVEAGRAIYGQGGTGVNSYVQIGHGGYGVGSLTTATSGSGTVGGVKQGVNVVAHGGNIEFRGGSQEYSYALIGNGSAQKDSAPTSTLLGDVSVSTSGDLILEGGSKIRSFAQIGNGGTSTTSNSIWHLGGEIEVQVGGSILAQGGVDQYSYVQIGHGGVATTTTSSIAASPVSITAGGDIHLYAGTVSYTGSKIGHGNTNLKLASFGDSPITVEAGGNIRLVSPQFDTFVNATQSATQIGHGGYGARVGDLPSLLGYSGDIEVTAGGKLDILAGKNAGSYTFSLIGHNSYFNSSGVHSGDITVTTGTQAGLADYGIVIHGGSGDYMPLASGNTTTGVYYSFASIGHRAHSNDTSTYSTGLYGDIFVDVVRGGISILGGDGVDGSTSATTLPDIRLNDAMIGHGGYVAGHLNEGISGSIEVYAEGDILLRTGTSRHAVTMIGHGGYNAFGPIGKAGDVIVVVSREGSLEIDSTNTTTSIRGGAMVGNGSPTGGSGTRMGDILVDVAGEISLLGDYTVIGHRSAGSGASVSNADITIRARSMDGVSGDSGSELFHVSSTEIAEMLGVSMGGGHLSLVGRGGEGILIGSSIVGNSSGSLNVLAYSDVYVGGHLLNGGTGDVNVFAGWDPAVSNLYASGPVPTADYREYWVRGIDADSDLFGTTGAYGNGKNIWIGANADLSAADRSVAVGSRAGETNVGAVDINIWGSALTGAVDSGGGKSSQIGYDRGYGGTAANQAVDGRIRVEALNDLTLSANHFGVGTGATGSSWDGVDQTGLGSYARIGHGGKRDSLVGSKLAGDILLGIGGDLSASAGDTLESYVQIGHGGISSTYAVVQASGDLTIDVDGEIDLSGGEGVRASVHLGHGGDYVGGTRTGDLVVSSDGDLNLIAGDGADASVRIGHGGVGANGNADGALLVTTQSVLRLQGGGDSGSAAVIGHGGLQGAGTIAGSVGVKADVIELLGGSGSNAVAKIGHGGDRFVGSVDADLLMVESLNHLVLQGGTGEHASAQIGHGGYQASGFLFNGDISVVTNSDLELEGGSGDSAFAQIGNLGASLNTVLGGDLSVLSGGNIQLVAKHGAAGAYAKIGHGHDYRPALVSLHPIAEVTGEIVVGAYGDLTMSDAMIGHLNAASSAGVIAGETQIAVGMSDPTDPSAGILVADVDSEFAGADGLRFYMARRGNNQIAAGAMLNGVSFPGARLDPSDTQRYDEYTVNIVGDEILFPNEHGNAFGTGAAPASAGNYAFYYDTITLIAGSGDFPIEGIDGGSVVPPRETPDDVITVPDLPSEEPFDYWAVWVLDQDTEAWLRSRKKKIMKFGSFGVYYEGYQQYGPSGESVFQLKGLNLPY